MMLKLNRLFKVKNDGFLINRNKESKIGDLKNSIST